MRRPLFLATALLIPALLVGCVEGEDGETEKIKDTTDLDFSDSLDEDAELYAIGDSIFDWNVEAGAAVPAVVGEALGRPMTNAAVGGATILGEESILEQYEPGAWSWLVMDGGGNDLNDKCGCGSCGDVMDEMLSADGLSGAIADFVAEVTASGTGVVFMGYPEIPDEAEFGFDRCTDELDEMSRRGAALAATGEGVLFVDMRDHISGTDHHLFDDDFVHPSIEGSRVMGEAIATAIRDAASE